MAFSSAICGGLVVNPIFYDHCKVSPSRMLLASSNDAVAHAFEAHCAIRREDVITVDCSDTEIDRVHQPGVAVLVGGLILYKCAKW